MQRKASMTELAIARNAILRQGFAERRNNGLSAGASAYIAFAKPQTPPFSIFQ